ncbi:MAG: hypothetical protein R3F41_10870 [Gammaproteobacteria bacterium]|nr:hypothetical protein [Pseudomonadales bacterium]MCP5348111.1 hypothetical protein [Pseudomonadales bacterium]
MTAALCSAVLPVNLLADLGYPVLSMETLIIVTGLGITGALIGAMLASSFLYAYFLSLVVYFYLEIYFLSWTATQIVISFVILLALTLLLRLTDTKLLPYILAFAVAFSLSAVLKPDIPVIVGSGPDPQLPTSQDQSILHIVMDEMASPYQSEYPPAAGHPAEGLLDYLVEQGFHVDANAYSVAAETVRSLSAIVALNPENTGYQAFHPGAVIANSVAENLYAKSLLEAGYEVFILQSSYLDYCQELESVHCLTYSRTGHINEISSAGLGERIKLAYLLVHEAMTSSTRSGVLLYALGVSLTGSSNPVLDFSVPLISHDLMQGEVLEQVSSIKPGEAYFVHLLLPHFPYVFGPDCEHLPIAKWGYPVRHAPAVSPIESYKSYWDQVACAEKLLSRIINATAGIEYLTTIIHGDHGARIMWQTENDSRDDDLKTLIAVRSSHVDPGLSSKPVILQNSVISYLKQLIE